jgi:hypothetical protein
VTLKDVIVRVTQVSYFKLPYFIEYSAHFFTLKMMLKYSLRNYTWKVAEKRFKMAFLTNILEVIYFCEMILEIFFFCQKSL